MNMKSIDMIYPVFYPHNEVQYDVTGRIVFWTVDLRRLREMEKRVVSLSASVQKNLDVCDHLCKEVTGFPGRSSTITVALSTSTVISARRASRPC